MKRIFKMLLALSLISLIHSCQDEELEVQTVSVNPVEQEIIEEIPFTLDEINDPILVNEYDNLNSLSKTILKEKLATIYSDKIDFINWDSVRLNTNYIYLENQTIDNKTYRFLVDIPRVENDEDFIPPLVNLRVKHDVNNDNLINDLHINDQDISQQITYDLEGKITNEFSNDVVKSSARSGGSTCTCWVVRDYKGVLSRINWVNQSSSFSGGNSSSIRTGRAPAAVWLQYARKTGNSQILSYFGIVRIAGTGWNSTVNSVTLSLGNEPYHSTNDLYIPNNYNSQIIPFSNWNDNYTRGLKQAMINYYRKAWNYNTSKYVTSFSLPRSQHLIKQSFIESFFKWRWRIQSQNTSLDEYFRYNPHALVSVFNLFTQYNLNNRDRSITLDPIIDENATINFDQNFVKWLSNDYLLNNDIELIQLFVSGKISNNDLESAYPTLIIKSESFKNSQAGRVFNELGGRSNTYKNIIKKFDGDFPVNHLKFSIDNSLPPTTNAVTDPTLSVNFIEIKFNGNNLNRPDLSIARTVIHETIHAEMFRKIRSLGGNVNPNDFPGIIDYYRRFGVNNWQHEQMANHYRNTMISILKEYKPGYSSAVYSALSWEGLMNTQAWNDLSSVHKSGIRRNIYLFNKGLLK